MGDKQKIEKLEKEIEMLREELSYCWQQVELVEGEPVVYVGVHAIRWRSEWGVPTVGFIQYQVIEPKGENK